MSNKDTAALRAARANIAADVGVRFSRWWGSAPIDQQIFGLLAIGVLLFMSAWESNNSGSGLAMVTRGTAPGWFAYICGCAVTIAYFVFHRMSAERLRNGEPGGMKLAIAAVLCAAITLFGAFSNLASKTELSSVVAEEQTVDRYQLRADIAVLEQDLSGNPLVIQEALLDTTIRQIKSTEAEAAGWGMMDTAPDGGCRADLKTRQRELCDRLNGSETEEGLRNKQRLYEAMIASIKSKEAQLADKRARLGETHSDEGAAHWSAMSSLAEGVGQKVEPKAFRIWGMFFFSVFVLFATGLGWDAIFEKAEAYDDEEED